jgi:hypothetical protein
LTSTTFIGTAWRKPGGHCPKADAARILHDRIKQSLNIMRNTTMRSGILAAFLLITISAPAAIAGMVMPDPAMTPADVVETQLKALQANDDPEADAGIAQTWALAHPDNKRVTGPLVRFARMIKGPAYQMLLNHRAHDVEEVGRSADEVVFAVTVTSEEGTVVVYQWRVGTVAEGEHAGAWMTTAVAPPMPAGQAI